MHQFAVIGNQGSLIAPSVSWILERQHQKSCGTTRFEMGGHLDLFEQSVILELGIDFGPPGIAAQDGQQEQDTGKDHSKTTAAGSGKIDGHCRGEGAFTNSGTYNDDEEGKQPEARD